MTVPTLFRRESADVQAMRLRDVQTASRASMWLHEHGVRCVVTDGGTIVIYSTGTRTVAHPGDWLTYDGEVFAVEADDGGRPSGHTKVEGEG